MWRCLLSFDVIVDVLLPRAVDVQCAEVEHGLCFGKGTKSDRVPVAAQRHEQLMLGSRRDETRCRKVYGWVALR